MGLIEECGDTIQYGPDSSLLILPSTIDVKVAQTASLLKRLGELTERATLHVGECRSVDDAERVLVTGLVELGVGILNEVQISQMLEMIDESEAKRLLRDALAHCKEAVTIAVSLKDPNGIVGVAAQTILVAQAAGDRDYLHEMRRLIDQYRDRTKPASRFRVPQPHSRFPVKPAIQDASRSKTRRA